MGEPTYWLDLFTAKTWQEFLDAGGNTSGFSAQRWNTVRRMKKDDILLCYLTGISRFIGSLRVSSEAFQDDTPIWSEGQFPSRVQVEVIHALTPETAVPVLDLREQLSVFRNLSNPNYWSGAFRAPRRSGTRTTAVLSLPRSRMRYEIRSSGPSTQRSSPTARSHCGPRLVP